MYQRLARRQFLCGIAASAAAAVLAACGGSKATETPKPAATSAASTPASAASTSGTASPVGSPTVSPSAPTATAASTVAPTGTVTVGASTPAVAASTNGTAAPAVTVLPANLTGKLTLYTSAVQTDVDGLKAAFNKKYPNVAVTIYRDGTEKVIAKLRAEQDAKSIQADVLLIADAPTMETLKADIVPPAVQIALRQRLRQAVRGRGGILHRHEDHQQRHRHQHDRESAEARDMEGPAQAGLQGQTRLAQPAVFRRGGAQLRRLPQ